MKIILVTKEQFELLWNKLLPQQRIMIEHLPSNIYLPHLNTVVVLGEAVKIGSIANTMMNPISLKWFTEAVCKDNYEVLT